MYLFVPEDGMLNEHHLPYTQNMWHLTPIWNARPSASALSCYISTLLLTWSSYRIAPWKQAQHCSGKNTWKYQRDFLGFIHNICFGYCPYECVLDLLSKLLFHVLLESLPSLHSKLTEYWFCKGNKSVSRKMSSWRIWLGNKSTTNLSNTCIQFAKNLGMKYVLHSCPP